MRSLPMLKCSSERWVCAPQSLSAGTSTTPRLSVSLLMSGMGTLPFSKWVHTASAPTACRRDGLHLVGGAAACQINEWHCSPAAHDDRQHPSTVLGLESPTGVKAGHDEVSAKGICARATRRLARFRRKSRRACGCQTLYREFR